MVSSDRLKPSSEQKRNMLLGQAMTPLTVKIFVL